MRVALIDHVGILKCRDRSFGKLGLDVAAHLLVIGADNRATHKTSRAIIVGALQVGLIRSLIRSTMVAVILLSIILLVLISIMMLSVIVLPIPGILWRSAYSLLRRIVVGLQRRETLVDLLLLIVIVVIAALVRLAVDVAATTAEHLLQDVDQSDDEARHVA